MKNHIKAGLAFSLSLMVASVAQADIKVGVAGPLTGANAAVGEQFRQGAERAAANINAAGGIRGEKILSFTAMTYRIRSKGFLSQIILWARG